MIEFDSRNFYFDIMDENDEPSGEYVWNEDLYEEKFELFKECFDSTMQSSILLIEGLFNRWNSSTPAEYYILNKGLQSFIDNVGKDINEIVLTFDEDKHILEYEGTHHDATNYFTVSEVHSKLPRKKLIYIAEKVSYEPLEEEILDFSGKSLRQNNREDLINFIEEHID